MQHVFNDPSVKTKRQILRKNMTEPEKRLWWHIRGSQLGVKFRRQYSVGSYILDFYVPEKKVCIEIDGDSHVIDLDYEKQRSELIASFGIRIIRYTNRDVLYNIEWVLENLRSVIEYPT